MSVFCSINCVVEWILNELNAHTVNWWCGYYRSRRMQFNRPLKMSTSIFMTDRQNGKRKERMLCMVNGIMLVREWEKWSKCERKWFLPMSWCKPSVVCIQHVIDTRAFIHSMWCVYFVYINSICSHIDATREYNVHNYWSLCSHIQYTQVWLCNERT